MAYFICEKQGRCCPHEFYDSIEQAITDSEDGVPCDHLIEVAPVRHGYWISLTECANEGVYCSICKKKVWKSDYAWCSKKSRNNLRSNYCPNCGATMDLQDVES